MVTGRQKKHLQEDVMVFVGSFLADNGFAPTYEEIRAAVGLCSRSHVSYYLDALEASGLIERSPRSPRSLRPTALGLAVARAQSNKA